ncbi:spermidine/putrescine ABC transporter permease [Deinococcus metalli]|uniref:Spermidine/putrescine ABC transporter permease n=2 Tax=Deinococcus metalli TaxID=1141878 RepID=A0ABQ3JX97_9DEIO|nr:spermidine/putrescine ABC transporter permease [Deinococcus metalli]
MPRMSAARRREAITGYLFILPWLIGFVVFVAGPMLFSLYASFTDYDVTSRMKWVGLDNYVRLFTSDDLFWTSLYNTGFYVLFAVPLGIVTGLLIAVLLNQRIPGQRVFRTIFFLPKVLTGVAVLLLWLWVFNPEFGPINTFLRFIGVQNPPLWFSDPTWAKPALIIMSMWGAAGGYIIYLAGLQGVPRHLYEAANLDGASPLRQFLSITVPMMSPTIFFKLITGISAAFQFWESALIVSEGGKGGPSYSTLFYGLYMWQKAFTDYQMGYASAMAWILLVIILIITALQFYVSRRWVYYEGEVR